MKHVRFSKIIVLFITSMLLCSCNNANGNFESGVNNTKVIESLERPTLLGGTDVAYDEEFTPQLQDYVIEPDFSNIINPEILSEIDSNAKKKLMDNLFVVTEANDTIAGGCSSSGRFPYEFYPVYLGNSEPGTKYPSFITTDSLLHSFHLLYEYQQKQTEEQFLVNRVLSMSMKLLANSKEQLSVLKGTDWESAAQRNVDYFSVAVALCGGTDYVQNDVVNTELQYINDASGWFDSPIFTTEDRIYTQDYTQFIVRGYYTDSESLQKYFKVMMWYGQMTFTQVSDELNKSALLINLALTGDALKDFECVYEITSFFAGESDDNTYYEYYPIIEFYFGDDVSISTICEKEEEFQEYLKYIAELPKPQINSMFVNHAFEEEEVVTHGFRLLGQRTSLDGIIIENLTYKEVKESDNGDTRNLPVALDVPAALGSDLALSIINERYGVDKWPNYAEQMEKMRQSVIDGGNNNYSHSVSSAWLGTLSTILGDKKEGWPSFMQGDVWGKKNLMTFLGSYTELKHNLLLYQKQPETGRGCGDNEVFKDDRGYVEPEPVVYHRLSSIIEAMVNGLKSYDMINENDSIALMELKEACDVLETISIKEINGELPTDTEFDFIRRYGGLLNKIWYKNASDKARKNEDTTQIDVEDYPNYLVTDIATDYDSQVCLELGEGAPMVIYVAVYFDGEVRIARGATYSVHEFTVPAEQRLTDDRWKTIIKSWDRSIIPPLPSWYEDIYTKTDFFKGDSWLGSQNMMGNAPSKMLTSLATVNIRDYPSTKMGNVVGRIEPEQSLEFISYVKNEGYVWYQLGWDQWVADDGTWFKRYSELDTSYEISTHRIKIIDDSMNVYSQPRTDYPTDENVYKGEQYLVMSIDDSRNHRIKEARYVWYKIGNGKYIKDNGEDRVMIIE